MRLRNGVLKNISISSGISVQYLSDMAATRKRPSREKAILLESACRKTGLHVPKELWLFGNSEEIKAALSRQPNHRSGTAHRDLNQHEHSLTAA